MGANVEALTNEIMSVLNDKDQDAWTEQNVWNAILEAEMVTAIFRPDATSIDVDFVCQAGTRQNIENLTDPAALRFLDAYYNVVNGAEARDIRTVNMGSIGRTDPLWRTRQQRSEVREIMFDKRVPMVFHNYPPVADGTIIRIAYSGEPAAYVDVDSQTVTTVSSTYSPMLKECALYRLFGHDVEGSVNLNRSQQHWANYQKMMGVKIEAETVFGPNNPEHKN